MAIGTTSAFGQEKFNTQGRIGLHTGVGFGIHLLSTNQIADKDVGGLTGNLRLGVDYGFTNWLTGGLVLFRNGFATDKDCNERASIGGVGVYAHFNFARRPKTTWYAGFGLGVSGLTYENFNNQGKATTSGSYQTLYLGFRRYFGDHFGIFVQAGASGYNYKELKYNSSLLNNATDKKWEMLISGMEIQAGLAVALGK